MMKCKLPWTAKMRSGTRSTGTFVQLCGPFAKVLASRQNLKLDRPSLWTIQRPWTMTPFTVNLSLSSYFQNFVSMQTLILKFSLDRQQNKLFLGLLQAFWKDFPTSLISTIFTENGESYEFSWIILTLIVYSYCSPFFHGLQSGGSASMPEWFSSIGGTLQTPQHTPLYGTP